MPKLPDPGAAERLRNLFAREGYSGRQLRNRIGLDAPPKADESAALLEQTREQSALNALVRLFLAGQSIDARTLLQLLPKSDLDLCTELGLIEHRDGRVYPLIVLVPMGTLLFASHAFGFAASDQAADFVLPASTHSTRYLKNLTLRDRVGSTLDLGCGCGVHALLAAAHSKRVVATDISKTALEFTAFNASLNQVDNIELLQGSLFEPVRHQQFDLIVSNPPFVLSPSQSYTYRDNPLELDEFCRQLLAQAPTHLNQGGHVQILCEWAQIQGQDWRARLAEWVRNSGCDAWILRSPALTPTTYARHRLSDLKGVAVEPHLDESRWVDFLESHKVQAIHPGMITLRHRLGKNWLHTHAHAADVSADAEETVRRGIEACDFLDLCSDDATLLEASLSIAPDLRLSQDHKHQDGLWVPTQAQLRLNRSISMQAEVDVSIIAFLNQIDGLKTVSQCINAFCDATSIKPNDVNDQLLSAVRTFISRGFLLPADLASPSDK